VEDILDYDFDLDLGWEVMDEEEGGCIPAGAGSGYNSF
jgi:hypothetical protein